MRNENLTIAEQKEKIEEWAKTCKIEGPAKLIKSKSSTKKMEDPMKEVNKNVTELIAYLPTAFKAFSTIMEDETLTRQQQKQKRRELTAKNPEDLEDLVDLLGEPGGPGGPFGGGPNGDLVSETVATEATDQDQTFSEMAATGTNQVEELRYTALS
ncbi:hypothetical protein COOONC_02915 [Cooperia oncophora]